MPAPRLLVRGQRVTLSDLGLGANFEIVAQCHALGGLVLDATCLGLDSNSRLSDERYFVFYNQPATPCGGIALLPSPPAGATGVFRVQLSKLPAALDRFIIAVSFDGAGQMHDLETGFVRLQPDGGGAGVEFTFCGQDFAAEKALMLVEFYRKGGVWRLAALGQGFTGESAWFFGLGVGPVA